MTEDLPYRLERDGADGWVMSCKGVGPVRAQDRAQANHIFEMVACAYRTGRDDAFYELRKLIGA